MIATVDPRPVAFRPILTSDLVFYSLYLYCYTDKGKCHDKKDAGAGKIYCFLSDGILHSPGKPVGEELSPIKGAPVKRIISPQQERFPFLTGTSP
jgi:hypothetical protein